jgi:adenine-specific DNA-methyltransferase
MAKKPIEVETLTHDQAKRRNIPTAELQSLVATEDAAPKQVRYPRETPLPQGERRPRNPDLDPQLVWRRKDEQDWSDLVVQAPPLYVQEKVHPKAIIADLLRQSQRRRGEATAEPQFSLFDDFNGLPDPEARLEFYAHDQNWSNRFILGDSLQVMASLAEKEGLRGQVQCIYFDPPYGIKFNSNFQWSTTSRDVRDGNREHITREPEQVRAYRDTWRDGIHSYLTYLRDRLTLARDLLNESGSIFVQIGDANVHRVRALMDEVFGPDAFVSQIQVKKSGGATGQYLAGVTDFILWYARRHELLKYRNVLITRDAEGKGGGYNLIGTSDGLWRPASDDELRLGLNNKEGRLLQLITLTSQRQGRDTGLGSAMGFPITFQGERFLPARNRGWTTTQAGVARLVRADRVGKSGNNLRYKRYFDDFSVLPTSDFWDDMQSGSAMDKVYVVQTSERLIERCLLMASDPGDLVLDPTCGSGTTATVAEQWGRRWITIDTSRVALALARTRLMGARYPYYLLADSPEGQRKEGEITRTAPKDTPTHGDIRQGFVCERVPHITLKSIANNAEIDVIWERWQATLEPLRVKLNAALGQSWEEWQVPREAEAAWPVQARALHAEWWKARIARQREIDASIAARAEFEMLHDKPYTDPGRVRVAGPFTVESLSPHRVVPTDDDELWDDVVAAEAEEAGRPAPRRTRGPQNWDTADFAQVILDHLKTSGVHQARKEDRITFTSLAPWPGTYIAAEGRFMEGATERRAAIFIGPEFGTVARPDLVAAAREASEAGFPLLIACAFNFEAHASEFTKLGPVQVIRARMNPDLHMADDLKNTGTGNLFVVFGEPDLDIEKQPDGQFRVRIKGLDIFDPSKGEIRAGGTDDIAAWFIDTDYNEESFFIRHAYFLGANDPYKALKTTLKAEVDEEAWETLYRDVSRPFPRPTSGRIAVKVINHFGDEVMKVFTV